MSSCSRALSTTSRMLSEPRPSSAAFNILGVSMSFNGSLAHHSLDVMTYYCNLVFIEQRCIPITFSRWLLRSAMFESLLVTLYAGAAVLRRAPAALLDVKKPVYQTNGKSCDNSAPL